MLSRKNLVLLRMVSRYFERLITMTTLEGASSYSEYWEISKSVLEPLLVGLPVVLNKRVGNPVPELQGDFLMLVDNTVEGYKGALEKLINDDEFREQLGRKAYSHSQKNWAPEKMEKNM